MYLPICLSTYVSIYLSIDVSVYVSMIRLGNDTHLQKGLQIGVSRCLFAEAICALIGEDHAVAVPRLRES